jgi:hypothetical protein
VTRVVMTLAIAAAALSAAPGPIAQPQSPDNQPFGFENGRCQPVRTGVSELTFSGGPGPGAVTSGPFWDLPVLVAGDATESFDADFDDSTGVMWLAFALDDSSLVRFYNSTDHGLSWSYAYRVEVSPSSSIRRMRVVVGAGDSNYVHAFFRVDATMGDLYDIRLSQDLSHMDVQSVLVGPDTVTWFDACRDNRPDYGLFILAVQPYTVMYNASFMRSADFGRTWTRQFGTDMRDPAICAGAGTYIHIACVHSNGRGPAYQYNYNRGDSVSWGPGSELNTDTFPSADPRVVVATTFPESTATAWVLYSHSNAGSMDWDADYAVRSDSWGNTWHKHRQLAATADAEYVADAKNDRESDNIYTDAMVVVSDTAEAESVVVHWSWANADAPETWSEPVRVSDTLKASPNPLPAIVFSPGAGEYPTPGVVFAGYGGVGAYFNADWFGTGAAEKEPSDVESAIRLSGNPSQGSVRFTPGMPVAEILSVRIFNTVGMVVRELPPAASVVWDGRDQAGRPLGSGAYVIRVGAARGVRQAKVLLAR